MNFLLHVLYDTGESLTLSFPHASLRGFAAIRYAHQLGVMLCFEDR